MTGTVTGAKFGIRTEIVVAVAGSAGYAAVIRTGSGPTWIGYSEQTQYVPTPTSIVLTAYDFLPAGSTRRTASGQTEHREWS